MALKFLALLCQFGLAAALAPGDCAFVGIYGDQDDFALVLMEDADGSVLSVTEESPSEHFKVSKSVAAKKHVQEAKRGTVLRKADFEADASSLVAPTSLTVFSGSADEPTALCSINLEAKQGSTARKLSEEVSVVMLGLTETAQYAGSLSGTKEELLEDISNANNWVRDASRKLSGFSIAKGNATMTMTTTMAMGNATMTMTMTTSMTMTMTTTMTAAASRTVVSGCTELAGPVDQLAGSESAITAFASAIGKVLTVDTSIVQNVVFTPGGGCGGRRLGDARRLQSGGTVTYDLVFPASMGALGSQAAATQAIDTLSSISVTEVTTALKDALVATGDSTLTALAEQVSVTSVSVPVITEGSGTTPDPTTTMEDEMPPDAACHAGAAISLLLAAGLQSIM